MTWFNTTLTIVIILFSVAVIGESCIERKKVYQSVLMLSIFCFTILNFFVWAY